ncbi:hypothetical protein G6F57_001895 [Rhizopus arrhizus]|nr:hypothetical protein G6F30_001476 [Rhizopus arrhizus]KAG1421780.1 hypothetical protein G6F58_003597 [Rhizopus delemar]KAG0986620.1 hypothetical protein G6F29_003134 [Rhizopus arrhizus]KAG0997904.1 hypothetical protein G6F28_002449 [Rhizopus arrhizus]KAG1012652.1 hypothetical protein G6F27_002612 [Rhizopus arrhizus]
MPSVDSSSKPLTLSRIYGTLTIVQSVSAAVYSVYVLIHGVQLVSANFGGVELANRTLPLTRPLYQEKGTEIVLVVGSALVHLFSGIAKFGIRAYWKRFGQDTSHPALLPYHRFVGHMQVPALLLHYYLVRLLPIQKYGDSSFIDFSYIGWGLQNRPKFTYALHTTLIVGSMYHAVSGMSFIYARYLKKGKSTEKAAQVAQHSKSVEQHVLIEKYKRNQRIKKGLVAALSITLISSLVIIGKDTTKIPLRLDFESMYSKIIGL